jgi:hypothetical protein
MLDSAPCNYYCSESMTLRYLGVTMGYRLDSQGYIPGRGNTFFRTPQCPPLGPTQPHMLCVPRAFFHWAKATGREADRTPLSGAEVKNDGALPPFSQSTSWCDALSN